MAFDNNEFDDDSGVFDIFFVETDEGHIVKTSQDIEKEKADEAQAEEAQTEEASAEEVEATPEEAEATPEEAPAEEVEAAPEEAPAAEEVQEEPTSVEMPVDDTLDDDMDIPEELTDDFNAEDDIIEEDVAAVSEEPEEAPAEEKSEAPEEAEETEESDIPDSLKTLTEVKQEKGDEKETSWGTSDGEANEPYIAEKSKKILGIGYSGFSIIIAAVFAIDAILFNFITYWASYWVSCKILHAIGIEALKLSEAKFEKFTISTAYILALVVGGALLFLLMFIAKKLMLEAEFEEGKEVVKLTVAFLLLLFIIGGIIAMISAKSIFVFTTYRWLAPVATYAGGLLIYGLSNLKFNQDF